MSLERIAAVLRDWLGIEPQAIGDALFQRVVEGELLRTGAADLDALAERVESRGADAKALARRLLVHETWMFRYAPAFAHLAEVARARQADRRLPLRVLCVPCSTGEEPASIAITLADAGLEPHEFVVDAFDVSVASVEAAREGWIRRTSFRGMDPTSRPDAIQLEDGRYRLAPALRARIRYDVRNILAPLHAEAAVRYDVVFCRNLLIYLTQDARRRALAQIEQLLQPGGLLYLGHAEVPAALEAGFVRLDAPGAFVCARAAAGRPGPPEPPPRRVAPRLRPRPRPRQREPIPVRSAPPAASPPPAPASQLEEARRLADRGYLEPARALLEADVRDGHVTADHFHLIAVLHRATGRPEEAHDALGRALYLDPGHYPALVQSALAAEERGDAEAARRLWARAARAEPEGGGRE